MPTGVTGVTEFDGGYEVGGGFIASTGSWISPQHNRTIGSPTSITNTWKDLAWSGTNVVGGSLLMYLVEAPNNAYLAGPYNLGDSPVTLSGNSVYNNKNLKVSALFQSGTSSTTPILYWYKLAFEPNLLGDRAGVLTTVLSGGSWSL